MSKQPARPVDEDGKPVFPAATESTEDVQGHVILVMEPETDEKPADKRRAPHLAV